MSARDVAELSRDHEPVMQQLLRCTQVLFTHTAQSSACNRHHAQEPQLCRFLLQHIDRQAGDELRTRMNGSPACWVYGAKASRVRRRICNARASSATAGDTCG